jgi:hypothetical protein
MRLPRVYISGPITKGSRTNNVYDGYVWQEMLMRNGFAPLNPIATCVAPFAWEGWASHDLWVACDLPWIEVADCVVRLDGESAGADIEVQHALDHNVPVFVAPFVTIQELIDWRDYQWQPK